MQNIRAIRDWLVANRLDALVVPSTDEFLNEFPPPANRELAWATGFTGSTGVAIIAREAAGLFLDGRYLLQGQQETQGELIEVRPTAPAQRRDWLTKTLAPGSLVALQSLKHSATEAETWRRLVRDVGCQDVWLQTPPLADLWREGRPEAHNPRIVDYPLEFAGAPDTEKRGALVKHLNAIGCSALFLADPEDISWLLNVRASEDVLQTAVGDWHVVPVCPGRLLLSASGPAKWFVDRSKLANDVLARLDGVEVLPLDTLSSELAAAARGQAVALDPARTPLAFTEIVEREGRLAPDMTAARARWRKHPNEIAGARAAHLADATAVASLMAWLVETVPKTPVTELDAARKLEALRRTHANYKGPSMPLMSAAGPNGSLPHYVPSPRTDRPLNGHPIYWIDSGGQYFGGTTDNTITLAVAKPEAKHIQAHTAVVKGYIALATAKVPVGIYGFALEVFARQPLWRLGKDYATGTGHGVGNFGNIHEGPYLSREPSYFTSAPIEPGMLLTNEPGFYAKDDFGIRIESHMASFPSADAGFVEFETISRFPIDPNLIDFAALSRAEIEWLADYHAAVLADVGPYLEKPALDWLDGLVSRYLREQQSQAPAREDALVASA